MIDMESKKDRQVIWNIIYAKSTLDITPIEHKVFIPINTK